MSKTFLFQTIQFSQTVLIQTIEFSIVFVYTQLHVKTVLFQTIQFSMSTQFNSISPIDRTLLDATTLGLSGPGNDGNEGVLHIPQSSSITGTSPSDCWVSYPGHSLGSLATLQKCSQCILQPQPSGQATKKSFCINMWKWLKLGSTTSLWSQISSQPSGQQQVKADHRCKHQQARFWPPYFGMHKVFCLLITLRKEEPSIVNTI